MACMRRDHIIFWVMKNDYKEPGCKKPGLGTELFLIFNFVGEPGLEDEPDRPSRSFVLSTLLLTSPLRVFAWDNLRLPGQNKMRLPGWDKMRLLGRDDMKLPGWDKMVQGKMWMKIETGQWKKT